MHVIIQFIETSNHGPSHELFTTLRAVIIRHNVNRYMLTCIRAIIRCVDSEEGRIMYGSVYKRHNNPVYGIMGANGRKNKDYKNKGAFCSVLLVNALIMAGQIQKQVNHIQWHDIVECKAP